MTDSTPTNHTNHWTMGSNTSTRVISASMPGAVQRGFGQLVCCLTLIGAATVCPSLVAASEPAESATTDVFVLLTVEELSAAHEASHDRSQEKQAPQVPLIKTDPEGPVVSISRPDLKPAKAVPSPFELQVLWQPRTGVEVDVDSLQVFYVENGAVVDGTSKVRQCQKLIARAVCRLDKDGLWVKKAEFPPGNYQVVMFVADTRRRFSKADFDVTVSAHGS